jgi:hypothetical protein
MKNLFLTCWATILAITCAAGKAFGQGWEKVEEKFNKMAPVDTMSPENNALRAALCAMAPWADGNTNVLKHPIINTPNTRLVAIATTEPCGPNPANADSGLWTVKDIAKAAAEEPMIAKSITLKSYLEPDIGHALTLGPAAEFVKTVSWMNNGRPVIEAGAAYAYEDMVNAPNPQMPWEAKTAAAETRIPAIAALKPGLGMVITAADAKKKPACNTRYNQIAAAACCWNTPANIVLSPAPR